MNRNYLRGVYLQLAGTVTLVVMLALAVQAYFSQVAFERALTPEMARKVASIGTSVRSLVLKAVDNGIPFEAIHGAEAYFDDVHDDSKEIASINITDTSGRVLYTRLSTPPGAAAHFSRPEVLALTDGDAPLARVGDQYIVSMPIASAQRPLGMLHIGVNTRFVNDLMLDMMADVLVVLVVSLFVTLELLHFLAGAKLDHSLRVLGETFERGAAGNFAARPDPGLDHTFGALIRRLNGMLARVNVAYASLERAVEDSRRVPAHERHPGLPAAQAGLKALQQRFRFGIEPQAEPSTADAELNKVRAPLFVFILAEELTRSFLPGYVRELMVPLPWLTPQMVVGLPIALFMLIVALAQPWLGVYCERKGHRQTMMQGAAIATVGFVASALAQSVLDLLLWRGLCAIGYAMVFVAAQAYVLHHATPATRARNFALFVGAIMAATVCGPSIGGILADNVGIRPTLALAATLALLSMAVIRQLPDTHFAADRPAARVPTWREILLLLRSSRFMAVTVLAAMPAKMLLTGVCFYLIPLYVVSLGSTQAMAGRMLMTYAVMMVVMAPLTAGWAHNRERMRWLVGGGLMVSGLGGLALLAGEQVGWVFATVLLVGLGQSLSISAQSALVSEQCAAEVAQLGEGAVYGVYRLLERLGNALGPMLAAVLLAAYGYRTSFVVIGCGVLACGAFFVLTARRHTAHESAATPMLAGETPT